MKAAQQKNGSKPQPSRRKAVSPDERKKLTKTQRRFIETLCECNGDEARAIHQSGIKDYVWQQWLEQAVFRRAMADVLRTVRRRARLILACRCAEAARRLAELTEHEKEETARKACIDVIRLDGDINKDAADIIEPPRKRKRSKRKVDAKTASAILELVSGRRKRRSCKKGAGGYNDGGTKQTANDEQQSGEADEDSDSQ